MRLTTGAASMKRLLKEKHRAGLRNRAAVTIAITATALSLGVLADDDRHLRDNPLPEDTYSDPWATEYENPFADPDDENHDSAPGRLLLYDDLGRRIGRIEEDPIIEGIHDLSDRLGQRTGRIDNSPLVDELHDR